MLAELPKQAAALVLPVSSQGIPHALPGVEEVGSMLTTRLGWRLDGGAPLALREMTVRIGTAVQLVGVADALRAVCARSAWGAPGLSRQRPWLQASQGRWPAASVLAALVRGEVGGSGVHTHHAVS